MLNLVANGPSGYTINNSLRFRSSASAYLNRTFGSGGSQTTWTLSFWVKRGALARGRLFEANGGTADTNYLYIEFVNDQLDIAGYNTDWLKTTQVFRDPSSWYHIVIVADTTQATAANRLKLYVNGSQVTAFATANYPTQNSNIGFNGNYAHYMGESGLGSTYYFDGYLTEINFVNAQALTPSSFGSTNSTTGVWQPAKYTGTYGTNGFYLNFNSIALTSGSNTGLGKDNSGNGNYWNTNNISVTAGTTYDAMIDVPTLTSATVANYAVMNPLDVNAMVMTQANLLASSTGATWKSTRSSIAMTSGKWYCEMTFTAGIDCQIGVGSSTLAIGSYAEWTTANPSVIYSAGDGSKYLNGTQSSYGATYTTNDVIGVAFDADALTVTFYKNNTSQGTITTGWSAGTYAFLVALYGRGGGTTSGAFNFGQRPFLYTPPTGYVALNTYNLPTSTIVQGNKYMDATLYTGTGASQTVTNTAAFKPDFVWIKSRNDTQYNVLQNSNTGAGKTLFSNTTGAETGNAGDFISSFNSNGFTVNTTYLGGTNDTVDKLNNTYVGWQWQAGQGSSSSNTNGSITSTVSVNATAGFSVVTYTGTGANATVGHGLGVAPSMIIIKSRNTAATGWNVYHTSLGNTKAMFLNLTDAAYTNSAYWNNTSPTSTVFSLGGANTDGNGSGRTLVAYCWAEIAGFSKFGSYTGNGSTDGPFIFTNFQPKYVMFKRTDTTSNWNIYDGARNTYNATDILIAANNANADASPYPVDFLSNGIKLRSTLADINASGGTYIYACFASNPFKNALAR